MLSKINETNHRRGFLSLMPGFDSWIYCNLTNILAIFHGQLSKYFWKCIGPLEQLISSHVKSHSNSKWPALICDSLNQCFDIYTDLIHALYYSSFYWWFNLDSYSLTMLLFWMWRTLFISNSVSAAASSHSPVFWSHWEYMSVQFGI